MLYIQSTYENFKFVSKLASLGFLSSGSVQFLCPTGNNRKFAPQIDLSFQVCNH